jgi:hypothetical protein
MAMRVSWRQNRKNLKCMLENKLNCMNRPVPVRSKNASIRLEVL